MDDTRPPEQRDALAHRVLQEWIAANARQQFQVHQIIDWLDEWTCLYIERVGSTTAVRTLDLQRSEPRL